MLRLDHIQMAIPAGSEDTCRAFWTGILGLVELPKPEGLAGRGGAWFQLGAHELHLGVEADFCAARKAHPAIAAPEIGDLALRLAEAGASVIWDDSIAGRRRFFTTDPVGDRIEFIGED